MIGLGLMVAGLVVLIIDLGLVRRKRVLGWSLLALGVALLLLGMVL